MPQVASCVDALVLCVSNALSCTSKFDFWFHIHEATLHGAHPPTTLARGGSADGAPPVDSVESEQTDDAVLAGWAGVNDFAFFVI